MTATAGIRSAAEAEVRDRLQAIARPDSRFQYDLGCFIPDFPGSAEAAGRMRRLAAYEQARFVFATPDNALISAREALLRDGKPILVPSYGLTQGFLLVDPKTLPSGAIPYAAWLDGIAHFGRTVTLAELLQMPPIDLCIVGAAAVARNGTRFGMGYHYFDIEWGLLAGARLVASGAQVVVPVHDCQVFEQAIAPSQSHVAADVIVTQSADIRMASSDKLRPGALDHTLLPIELANLPVVREYDDIVEKNQGV